MNPDENPETTETSENGTLPETTQETTPTPGRRGRRRKKNSAKTQATTAEQGPQEPPSEPHIEPDAEPEPEQPPAPEPQNGTAPLDLAIVTTAWGNYGQYLAEWVDSILEQEHRPAEVLIVDCGMDNASPARKALKRARSEGIDARMTRHTYNGMGDARNHAVSQVYPTWVMHLDADDTLLPHALSDIAELMTDDADVICLGAQRQGRSLLLTDVSANKILGGPYGSYSPSVFRRSLWEKSPYLTSNDWVESALWVGFAHLGARFVPTQRAGFVYRQHSDSHSASISALEKKMAHRQLEYLRQRWDPTL